MERNGSQGTDNASVHINSKTRANASCAASPPPTLHQPLQVNSAANKSWLINYVEATLPRHIINALTSTQASLGENTHKHTNTHSHANSRTHTQKPIFHERCSACGHLNKNQKHASSWTSTSYPLVDNKSPKYPPSRPLLDKRPQAFSGKLLDLVLFSRSRANSKGT